MIFLPFCKIIVPLHCPVRTVVLDIQSDYCGIDRVVAQIIAGPKGLPVMSKKPKL